MKYKFRGINIETDEYVCAKLGEISNHSDTGEFYDGALFFKGVPVDVNSIRQFVGYDENGNELYEHDGVKDNTGDGWCYLVGYVGMKPKPIGETFDGESLDKEDK